MCCSCHEVKVIIQMNDDCLDLFPEKAHLNDAGYDLKAAKDYVIPSMGCVGVSAGFKMNLPSGYEAQIRSRSGNALKKQLFVLNSPGTVDSNYTGDIGVILMNLSKEDIKIYRGDKIAQMVICKLPEVELIQSFITENDERGSNGFGSTGLAGNDWKTM